MASNSAKSPKKPVSTQARNTIPLGVVPGSAISTSDAAVDNSPKRTSERKSGAHIVAETKLANESVQAEALAAKQLLAAEREQRNAAILQLESRLGHTFSSRDLLDRALTHRSALEGKFDDYERLEFLGDAVIDLAVAHLLVERHPALTEGDLSKMRAALVNTQALADLAIELGLGPLIRLGRAEKAGGGQSRPALLADVFEALTGVLYRDAGFPRTLEIVEKLFNERVVTVKPRDPKTELQEILQAVGGRPPEYLLEFIEGPEHSPVFVTIVKVEGVVRGRGRGQTKKASQQAAASEALEYLRAEQSVSTQKEVGTATETAESAAQKITEKEPS